ncbi:hypothetical protein [Pontibacter sp. G13]|uniref:hypothetical protein n=1 Tax=Pontibacter sp. G13 TaxID=3074898 RepID=UPI00288B7BFB|nr:hypothetical protein [Pontibacter sp. G13]WNJ16475.1 hypothetical protein RJD25_16540 [Pontibacter sp. G13]
MNTHREAFIGHLLANYPSDSQKVQRPESLEEFVNYLLEIRLISEQNVRHYLVLHEYRSLRAERAYRNKSQTIRAMAENFSLHENTIWNILKDQYMKFEPH